MMAHSELVACGHGDITGRHFGHAYDDETHEACGDFCIDEVESGSSRSSDARRELVERGRIQISRRDREIGFRNNGGFQDPPDRGISTIITLRAEESLEHRRTTRLGVGIVVFDEIFGI